MSKPVVSVRPRLARQPRRAAPACEAERAAPQADGKPKRIRLKPEVRAKLILDAALVEFSQHGFTAARIEDIAARAGLTKTGVYGHYESKDAIFEALLHQLLMRPKEWGVGRWHREGEQTLASMIDAYLDAVYGMLQAPATQQMFRLLLTESIRMPSLLTRWFEQVLSSHEAEQAQIDECVRLGVMRQSPLTANFMLAQAPAVMWMLSAALKLEDPGMGLAQVRQTHRFLLLELLQPR